MSPLLIAFSGLPAVGKSSVARKLAKELDTTYLRVDTAEQALRQSGEMAKLTIAGYAVLYALAADNLALGRTVVADSVNPFALTRNAWRDVGARTGAHFVAIELVCSDKAEHRRRVETRQSDIAGLRLPDWHAVETREYENWTDADIVMDTTKNSVEDVVAEILLHVEMAR